MLVSDTFPDARDDWHEHCCRPGHWNTEDCPVPSQPKETAMTTAESAAKSRAHSAVGVFQNKLDEAKDRLSDVQEAIHDRSEEAVATAEKYVGEHPWKALAVVGSIGIILGMLIGRR